MELTLKANGFTDLSLDEMQAVAGGGWWEVTTGVVSTVLIKAGTVSLFIPGGQIVGVIAIGFGVSGLGSLID